MTFKDYPQPPSPSCGQCYWKQNTNDGRWAMVIVPGCPVHTDGK